MKAVIDRVSEEMATLLFGPEEIEVVIPTILLPQDAKEGSWLNVCFEVDEAETKTRLATNQELLDKILRKNKED